MPKGGNSGGGGGGGGGGKPGGGGGDGPLSLNGNKKDNTLIGGEFDDNIWGRNGNDTLYGMGGDDFIVGGNGNDVLYGDFGSLDPTSETDVAGDDRLFGGNGDDELYGGDGDDELQGGDGWDILDGGDGFDIALYSADDYSIVVTSDGTGTGFYVEFFIVLDGPLDPAAIDPPAIEYALHIEGIVGTYYDDIMIGADTSEYTLDGYVNVFNGYYGNDLIYGGAGADWLDGHGDIDTIDGMAGADMIAGGSGADMLTGGPGADTFVYYSAYDGADTITDFSGDGGEGDKIDLTALGLTARAAAAAGEGNLSDPITDGFVFVVGDQLYVDLNGGGPGEMVDGELVDDDILIATTTGVTVDLANDVIFDVLVV